MGPLTLYSLAWRAAWPLLQVLSRLETLARRRGVSPWPASWSLRERMSVPENTGRGRRLWIHCASLGESKGVSGLLHTLDIPFKGVILTSGTHTGRDFLQKEADRNFNRPGGCLDYRVEIAPFDHLPHVREFLHRHEVAALCLYEVEIWPHYLKACRESGVPILLAAGRMSSRAFARLRPWSAVYARLLSSLDYIQTQSEADSRRFEALGVKARLGLETGADFRLLHFLSLRSKPQDAPTLPWPARRGRGFAFISLHLSELRTLLPAFRALPTDLPVLVFPRLPEELAAFRKLLHPLGFADYDGENVGKESGEGAHRLLVCQWGRISHLLPTCFACFVGGSLVNRGCHNLWEPWLAGLRVYFGPSLVNQEVPARMLRESGWGKVIGGPQELSPVLVPESEITGGDRWEEVAGNGSALPPELEFTARSARKRFAEVLEQVATEVCGVPTQIY